MSILTSRQIAARELRRIRSEHPNLHSRPASYSKVWAAARLRVRASRAMMERQSKCIKLYVDRLEDAARLLSAA